MHHCILQFLGKFVNPFFVCCSNDIISLERFCFVTQEKQRLTPGGGARKEGSICAIVNEKGGLVNENLCPLERRIEIYSNVV